MHTSRTVRVCVAFLLRACVAILLKLTELAKPVETPWLRCDTPAQRPFRVQEAIGRQESLAAVKAAPAQRAHLGSATVLTPVRRSTRTAARVATPDISAQLQATQYAYAPNAALFAADGTALGEDHTPRYANIKEETVEVETLLARMHSLSVKEEL